MEAEGLKPVHNCQHLISPAFPAVILNFLDDTHNNMFILSLVSGSWHLIEDMGPPVQLLPQQSKYFHGNKNLHLFYKSWDDRGKYRIRTPTFFFHTTYVNSLTSEYKHMTILFSKENDTNEWMILFLLKIIHYTNIDFTQFKKLNIKIYISSI